MIGLSIGFYALHTDFSFFNIGRNGAGSGNSIGSVSQVESDVRVRGTKNIFWQNARSDDVVAQGDSLFVGPDSSIVVKFEDGTSITIGANSLIKFKTEGNQVKLNLQYGSIKSQNLPSNLVLDDCGKSVNIESKGDADLEIGKSSECGKIQVKSKKGEVKVNNQVVTQNKDLIVAPPPTAKLMEKPLVNEALVKLESLSALDVAKLNEMKPEDVQKKIEAETKPLLPPQLIRESAKIIVDKDRVPAASWAKAENAKEYILETADNPEFNNPTVTRTPASISKIESTSDQVYYRLKSVGNNNATSEYSKTGKIDLVYPSIKLKDDKIVYDYIAKDSQDVGKPKNFNVRWNEVPNADKYVVEVANKDGDFTKAQSYTVRTPASAVKIPGQGKYQYRVSAYNKAERKISSTSKMGEIFYNRIFDMKTPVIAKAASSLQFFFQKGLGKYIWLKWMAPESKSTDKFRVEISKDQNFSNLFQSYSTNKNKVLVQENIPAGQYFWRVRAEGQEKDQVSDWSKPGFLEVNSGAL
ncbi:hypothetical protein CIK05_05805 [Bdellovibrio sp. qaytius]|nr:hypothetical protein CIK05_05805 [Bdellovibrio sp. qaytius]